MNKVPRAKCPGEYCAVSFWGGSSSQAVLRFLGLKGGDAALAQRDFCEPYETYLARRALAKPAHCLVRTRPCETFPQGCLQSRLGPRRAKQSAHTRISTRVAGLRMDEKLPVLRHPGPLQVQAVGCFDTSLAEATHLKLCSLHRSPSQRFCE